MAARAESLQRGASRRGIALALLLAAAFGGSAFGSAPAAWGQGEEPATDQYTDPFAELGTGRQAPAWNPFSRDFGEPLPPRVRRRLERVEDGPTLQMLLAQVVTERARTGGKAAPRGRSRRPRPSRRATAREVEEPSLAGATAGSVFEGSGPQGALLAVGLAAVAAIGVTAAWTRRRRQPRR